MDTNIEQSCPKKMWKIPPEFSGPIRNDKAHVKVMTLSNKKSFDFYNANRFVVKENAFFTNKKGTKPKTTRGIKKMVEHLLRV